ncbi:hypothetical protein ACPA9J_10840 [Pseudomonas aeruginosa]
MTDYTQQLAGFLAGAALPGTCRRRCWRRMEELFLDWLGSALAGEAGIRSHCSRALRRTHGPADGSAQILPSRRRGSPTPPPW